MSTLLELVVGQEALSPGCLLGSPDLESLSSLDGAYEVAGVIHGLERPGVQPGCATRQHTHLELSGLEVVTVNVGDLVLAARRRPELAGDLNDVVVVKVEARDGVVGPRMSGLLLQRDGTTLAIEFDHAVRARLRHPIGEDRSPFDLRESAQLSAQTWAVEDVVAEHQRDLLRTYEVGADHESLGKSVR